MFLRAHVAYVFLVMFGVAGAGLLGATGWAIAPGACALALASLTRTSVAAGGGLAHGIAASPALWLTSIAMNATVFSVFAYVFGRILGWLSGLDTLLRL